MDARALSMAVALYSSTDETFEREAQCLARQRQRTGACLLCSPVNSHKCCNYTATAHSLSLSSSNFLYLLLFSKLLEINHALTLIFISPFPRFTQLVVVFLLSHAFFFILLLLPILARLHSRNNNLTPCSRIIFL